MYHKRAYNLNMFHVLSVPIYSLQELSATAMGKNMGVCTSLKERK